MSTEIKSKSEHSHAPWNKGRLVGQKHPLRPKEVWAIRVRLQIKHRKRDLAMFNLAIDSKLRGCDLVSLRVDDIAAGGRVRDGRPVLCWTIVAPVQFEITEQTREPGNDHRAATQIAQVFRHTHPHMAKLEDPQVADWAAANRPRALRNMMIFDDILRERPFIAGERFTVADITGLVALDFARPARLAIPPDLANLNRWHAALKARPSAAA